MLKSPSQRNSWQQKRSKCGHCRRIHGKNCPAKNTTCLKCIKLWQFIAVCHTKSVCEIEQEQDGETTYYNKSIPIGSTWKQTSIQYMEYRNSS